MLAAVAAACAAAPIYAHAVADTNPFESNVNGTTVINGRRVPVIQQGTGRLHLGENPIGPTLDPHHFFLGADAQGRDVAARLLYGGQSTLEIGVGAALLSTVVSVGLALLAAGVGGPWDFTLSRLIDIIWAFPVYLFGITLATVLITSPHGLALGPVHISASSRWLPTLVIAVIFVPWLFRPLRAHVLTLREQEFTLAAVAQGSSTRQILLTELLPNVVPVVITLFPLLVALTIPTEAGLSFLGVGVQAPGVSWGTMIADGEQLLYTQPWVAVAPGLAIVTVVVALNLLADVIRDVVDPRGAIRAGA